MIGINTTTNIMRCKLERNFWSTIAYRFKTNSTYPLTVIGPVVLCVRFWIFNVMSVSNVVDCLVENALLSLLTCRFRISLDNGQLPFIR